MNSETIQITYEAIENPILRLLIILGVGVITSLAGAVVYLYRERQALQREMIDMNREAIRVYESTENTIENITRELGELRDVIVRKTT